MTERATVIVESIGRKNAGGHIRAGHKADEPHFVVGCRIRRSPPSRVNLNVNEKGHTPSSLYSSAAARKHNPRPDSNKIQSAVQVLPQT
jgi:hypothetical protein